MNCDILLDVRIVRMKGPVVVHSLLNSCDWTALERMDVYKEGE